MDHESIASKENGGHDKKLWVIKINLITFRWQKNFLKAIIAVMEKRKIKYSDGDLLIIDLEDRGKFLGLITRRRGRTKILAGFFWNFNFEINNDLILKKSNAIMSAMFSGLGFEIGNWQIIGRYDKWRKEEWAMLKFRRYDELRKSFYAIIYNDNIEEVAIQKVTESEAALLYEDGLHGYISLENYLAKVNTSDSNKN